MKSCAFCQKEMSLVDHANKDLLDVYICADCQQPEHDTRYRQICYKDEEPVLATTIHIDDFYVILNYAFSFITRRTNFTTIFRKAIGAIDSDLDLAPIVWIPSLPVVDLDIIIRLPYHDIKALKKKLQIYTLFS